MSHINRSKKEIQHSKLVLEWVTAKNSQEKKLLMEEIVQFEKDNPQLVDEIQSRRWLNYGDGSE